MKYYVLDKLNKTINFEFKDDNNIVSRIKYCGYSVRYNSIYKQWIVDLNEFTINKVKEIIREFDFKQRVIEKPKEKVFDYSITDVAKTDLENRISEIGFNYVPRDYQLECLAYSIESNNVLNGDDVGCIDGDAEIQVRRGGKLLDIKLSQLYAIFKNSKKFSDIFFTESFDEENNLLVLNKIENVLFKGKKDVLKVTLSSGKQLKLTPEHPVYSELYGWIDICKLSVGDKIISKHKKMFESILSIKKSNKIDVYDIVMKDPHRSFVANKILVHNCGKTFESILYAEVSDSFPCLVVVPASVKYNWLEKWQEIVKTPRSMSVIESGSKNNNWKADIVFINYDIIAKKQGKGATVKFEELKTTPWKMVIFDEAHFLKNKDSQRAKASKMIVKNKPIVQLLSGTITMSKPIELWNLLCLANQSEKVADDWFDFIKRYCGGYKGKFGWVTNGATNVIELNEKLRNSCYIRREKSEVLKELPSSIKSIIKVPLTNTRKIKSALKDFIQYIRENKGEEKAEKAMEAEHLVALSEFRKLAIEGKLKAIEQYIKDYQKSGEKLLVFGLHREALEYFSQKYSCPLIAGGVSSQKKQQIVNDWKKSKDQFLFANIISAGTGVDGLQEACSNMLIIELPWRPSDLTQAIGRLHRSGQTKVTNVTFLLNLDLSIDKEMWKMLQEKEIVTEAVNKGVDVSASKSSMKYVLDKILENNL